MDNNWWYYTLSAGAQVFAALIAVSAAAVAFKLNIAEKEELDYKSRIIRWVLVPVLGGSDATYVRLNSTDVVKKSKLAIKKLQAVNFDGPIGSKVVQSLQQHFGTLPSGPREIIHDNMQIIYSIRFSIEKIKSRFFYSIISLTFGMILNFCFIIFTEPDYKLVQSIVVASVLLGIVGIYQAYRIIRLDIFSK